MVPLGMFVLGLVFIFVGLWPVGLAFLFFACIGQEVDKRTDAAVAPAKALGLENKPLKVVETGFNWGCLFVMAVAALSLLGVLGSGK